MAPPAHASAPPPAAPAAAAPSPLPLGTVTILSNDDPQCSSLPGASCHKFKVACPGVSVDILGYYAIQLPPGPSRGMLLFFSGGGGNFYWAKEKISAGKLIDKLRNTDGFTIAQVRWGTAWENPSAGEQAGVAVTCRPATIVDYLRNHEYVPPTPTPGVGMCGFCVAGPSGGSAQAAYPISHYGLDFEIDGVFPISGPTHAAITKGCLRDRRFDQYWYDGVSTRRVDGPFGFIQDSGPFAVSAGPCVNHDPSFAAKWDVLGVDTGGSDYFHPNTRVHIVMGQLDKIMRAHGNDYLRALLAGGSPFVQYELIPGMGHGITEFTVPDECGDDPQTCPLANYPGLVAMEAAFVLTDPARLPGCNDDLDDDGDGLVDYPNDPGCSSAADASETGTDVCDDGLDNDGDGRIDFTADDFGDPGCASPADTDEKVPFGTSNLQCDDGVDNDGDGRADYPDDPGCVTPRDTDPTGNAEIQPAGFGPPPSICDDGLDNDGDGFIDGVAAGGTRSNTDPDCAGPGGTTEKPNVSIQDWTGSEGGAAAFVVTLSSPQPGGVTVTFTTSDGTATAGQDYLARTGTVTFGSNDATPKIASVDLVDDGTDEVDENFTVTLSGQPGAVDLADAAATGTIQDDDGPPSVSIAGASTAEGNTGTKTLALTASLSAPSGKTVSVGYATADGTAAAPGDYQAASGAISFTPGQTSLPVTVTIVGDSAIEANETFTVALSAPVNVTLGSPSTASGTITNDDAPAGTLSISDASALEGNAKTSAMTFTVTLSAPSTGNVSVQLSTADGSATANSDYKPKATSVSFSPGQTSRPIAVTVYGDKTVEPDETFTVNLTGATGATIQDGTGVGTILNDDTGGGPVTISISDGSVLESGAGQTAKLKFTITLSGPASGSVTVQFATVNGTALAGSDYKGKTGTVSFNPGETSKSIGVVVVGDATPEPDETFTVVLSNPTGATILDGSGTGAIRNDD